MKALALVLLGACTVKDSSETGPMVHISLETFLDTVTDQSTNRTFTLESGDSYYGVAVGIQSSPGEADDGTNLDYHYLSTFNASITVPNVTIPTLNFMDDSYGNYNLEPDLMIPASAKGQMMTVHLDGVSDDGLASNVIDLKISLK